MSIISRVSTLQMSYYNQGYVETTSANISVAGKELATGRHADIFATLGASAASALSLRNLEDNTQAFMQSNDFLSSKLQAMLDSVDATRDHVDEMLQSALTNAVSPEVGADYLQDLAQAALDSIIGTMNISFNGDHLFSGTQSREQPLVRWSEANEETGLSPQAVMQSIIGSGPATLAEAQAMMDEIDLIFASEDTANPDRNFEATFYNGTPALDDSGDESNRVTGRIDTDRELSYGVQANDEGIRESLKGLMMLAAVDVTQISDADAYKEWMTGVIGALSAGSQETLIISTLTGFNQQVVETAQQRLSDISSVRLEQIGNYENVDPYEAAVRLSSLETQLEASYAVTARLSQLTILNYIS